jgi:hypothetical protein
MIEVNVETLAGLTFLIGTLLGLICGIFITLMWIGTD